ncbi:response regulator [Streptomyces sp. M19]
MTKVLVVNDKSAQGPGYRTLFEESPDLAVAGSVGSVHQAITALATHRPDIVVVDSQSRSPDTVDMIRTMVASAPKDPPPILLLTEEFDDRLPLLHRLGVRGLLLDRCTAEEIVAAVRLVAAGYALLLPAGKHCTDPADDTNHSRATPRRPS